MAKKQRTGRIFLDYLRCDAVIFKIFGSGVPGMQFNCAHCDEPDEAVDTPLTTSFLFGPPTDLRFSGAKK
jgi:hypothetical protein